MALHMGFLLQKRKRKKDKRQQRGEVEKAEPFNEDQEIQESKEVQAMHSNDKTQVQRRAQEADGGTADPEGP